MPNRRNIQMYIAFSNVDVDGKAVRYDEKPNKDGQRCDIRPPPRGGTPYNGLYGEAPPERGTFSGFRYIKMVGISQVEVNKRVGKSVI